VSCRSAAVVDVDLLHAVGYSPLTASCIFEFESYEPDRVFIDFVEALRDAIEEKEDG